RRAPARTVGAGVAARLPWPEFRLRSPPALSAAAPSPVGCCASAATARCARLRGDGPRTRDPGGEFELARNPCLDNGREPAASARVPEVWPPHHIFLCDQLGVCRSTHSSSVRAHTPGADHD